MTRWVDDPDESGRQVGRVEVEALEYVRPVGRIAVRKRKPNGQRGIAVLISNLLPDEAEELGDGLLTRRLDPVKELLLAHVHLYDQRGGGVETSFKGDKQGIALSKQCTRLGTGVVGRNDLCSAAPRTFAFGARCFSYQWLSPP